MTSSVRNDSALSSAEAEIARLRAQVVRLESQLAETEEWANRIVVEAQAKTYWLDRWGIDVNALMRRPAAHYVRATARRVRSVYRLSLRWKRRVVS